ncbi:MAG: diaminopimelate decarboxylase [Lachnospiraceae bacterium]|nr:diaminopimelate decarboxylase [Lachnospiraceae bacterium]
MICDNIENKNGKLYFNGLDVTELAKKYGTPLYLMDENKIRNNLDVYKNALKKYFGDAALVLYASKAAAFKYIYKIMQDENVGIDVVSSGEIWTAYKAGFDLSKAYFHSNNKTDFDVEFAIEKGVGYFVADNIEEINVIEKVCEEKNTRQKVLLRVTPGIDTHTYEADKTGQIDSKFGTAIETGQAIELVGEILKLKNIDLCGFHCHVGSQVFEEDVFERTAVIMINFFNEVKNKYNFETNIFDIGGGIGTRYVDTDPIIDVDKKIKELSICVKNECEKYNLKMPEFRMEPGRSIVADAGMTLYTVGTIKKIPGYKNYVSIDGGMTDNPRFALYNAEYTVYTANKMDEKNDFKADLVGRCCESGDIIKKEAMFPRSIRRGDIVAVATTGAYNYSMASNYNRLMRPAVVMIKDGKDFEVVKRETLDDLIANDL